MKLNLVPTYVSKERQGRTAFVGAFLFIVLGVVASVLMTMSSKSQLAAAIQENEDAKPKAQAAVDTSSQADTIIASATQIIKDTNLATAMVAHNDVYPDFYTKVILPYIPPFFRINSLSATPIDAATANVTMVGTLKTYQQYTDLVLALMRNPAAISVGRNGFSGEQFMVPGITPEDQIGKYRKTTDPTIPDDPLQKLAYYEAQATPPTGYLGVGNFGSGSDAERGATPDESLITIQLTVKGALQTPDPRATLRTSVATAAAAPAATLTTGFGAPTGVGATSPGGPPPGKGPGAGAGGD
jgi:hypothetical protein